MFAHPVPSTSILNSFLPRGPRTRELDTFVRRALWRRKTMVPPAARWRPRWLWFKSPAPGVRPVPPRPCVALRAKPKPAPASHMATPRPPRTRGPWIGWRRGCELQRASSSRGPRVQHTESRGARHGSSTAMRGLASMPKWSITETRAGFRIGRSWPRAWTGFRNSRPRFWTVTAGTSGPWPQRRSHASPTKPPSSHGWSARGASRCES